MAAVRFNERGGLHLSNIWGGSIKNEGSQYSIARPAGRYSKSPKNVPKILVWKIQVKSWLFNKPCVRVFSSRVPPLKRQSHPIQRRSRKCNLSEWSRGERERWIGKVWEPDRYSAEPWPITCPRSGQVHDWNIMQILST